MGRAAPGVGTKDVEIHDEVMMDVLFKLVSAPRGEWHVILLLRGWSGRLDPSAKKHNAGQCKRAKLELYYQIQLDISNRTRKAMASISKAVRLVQRR
jgi:hypothetical protein